jgi:hypothetical protein
VPSPPADLAHAVLERARKRSRRRLLAVSSATAAVVISSIALVSLRRPDSNSQGSREITSRTTLQLADRAVVVAEAGTKLSWQVEGGAASVTQDSGNVFYRVEPGGPFVVTTPKGTVKVLGTCFRLQVRDANVRLSVHEGKVLSASLDGDRIEVPAGKVALMDDGTPTIVSDLGSNDEAKARNKTTAPLVLSGNLEQQNQLLLARTRALEAELAELRERLDKSSGQAKKSRFLDLTKEETAALAKKCELRWDNPCHGSEPPEVTPKDQRKAGLTDAEVKIVNAVLAEQFDRTRTEIRRLYIEVTGDTKGVDNLSPSSMSNEIMDKSPREETRIVYQRLASERAGLQPAPADTSTASPLERLMRLLTSIGDRTEKAIGDKIGPDLARRYRALHGGFSSKSRSSSGCPDE